MDFFISNAMAAGEAPQGGGLQLVFMVALFFGIMYFMIIRPQSKKAKEHASLLDALTKGDEVVTNGGILGKIVKLGDNFIELKISDSSNMKIQRHAIASIMPKGTMKGA
ncbi:MAG: preprotein translocase subunit YajC [Cocleimonas sp.]|nr:preprotein translocase subunit YajC [Cocleimonas sp.]